MGAGGEFEAAKVSADALAQGHGGERGEGVEFCEWEGGGMGVSGGVRWGGERAGMGAREGMRSGGVVACAGVGGGKGWIAGEVSE